MRTRGAIALLLLLTLTLVTPAHAQDENLLRDGGFDAGYTGRGRPDLNVPGAWGLWLADAPRTRDWQNRPDKVFAFPHTSEPERRSGAASLNLSGGFVTFTAAVYQQVSVPPNTNVQASAWAWLHTCNLARNDDGSFASGTCGSAVESGAFTRVGIDPNGGTDPTDADIVWSPDARPHDRWEQMTANATATGPVVTVFLYATQASPSDLNNVYWDDAALVLGGTGGTVAGIGPALPQPTAQPAAPIPVAQAAQADGSLVHVIRPGDTIDGLALIYGVTRARILELNPNANPRLLRIGDRILVREAD